FALGFQLRVWFGRLIGAGLTGGVMGMLFWIIAGPLLAALAVGMFTFVAMLVLGTGQTRRSSGDWLSGHWSSGGGDWGGSGGGGGFGGGGGGFSGGGASGGW
ncbi:MAG: YgcG family protein, partial [Gammaproteobacteria bacterium]|nr:YgcG family protein [Gammaproteobacteria bacterium]